MSRQAQKRHLEMDDDYTEKRMRNNIAVRKSREKSRAKAHETQERVSRLRRENAELEVKLEGLSKELHLLKELFLSHAKGVASQADKCPDILADVVVPSGVEEKEALEESEESFYSPGTPVNEEGLRLDHEYSAKKKCEF